MISPDGFWRWDGVRWIPNLPNQPAPAGGPMPKAWVALTVIGTVAALLLAGTGLAALPGRFSLSGLPNFAHAFAQGCLPSDFPLYPGAVPSSFTVFNGPAGSECLQRFVAPDTLDQITAFYQQRLQSAPWLITNDLAAQGIIDFARQANKSDYGKLTFTLSGTYTVVRVDYHSSLGG